MSDSSAFEYCYNIGDRVLVDNTAPPDLSRTSISGEIIDRSNTRAYMSFGGSDSETYTVSFDPEDRPVKVSVDRILGLDPASR